MWQKLFEWLIKKVIIPILRQILIYVFNEILKKLFDKIKDLLNKWREEEKAKNPENKEDIDKKYDGYQKDIEKMEKEIFDDIPNVINESTKLPEKSVNELLDKPKQIESKKKDNNK